MKMQPVCGRQTTLMMSCIRCGSHRLGMLGRVGQLLLHGDLLNL